ncbi:hypothetical protein BBD42_07830 [Paenibacillus sp. BIHB 4019]|uniref:Uncharacterized protein n=1 Tax=Paenibacillus sp. BIHB 4019 TaxID=1870819 RepID=A0A1B2DF87_9BACL|nr:hypothetical protein [Paenibacillus sp. BIHB 4019]ANY66378.1 hypothetical protein BBD42_07830 [Paenibacillus sp. BIHB 4019]
MSTAHSKLTLIAALAACMALLTVYFLMTKQQLFGSQWLIGFASSLAGSILSFCGPFQARKQSLWHAAVAWVNFLLFGWYIFMFSPLAVLFFGP